MLSALYMLLPLRFISNLHQFLPQREVPLIVPDINNNPFPMVVEKLLVSSLLQTLSKAGS